MGVLALIYLVVALGNAFLIGRGVRRGDEQQATLAIVYCALWPVGILLLLGSLAGAKSRGDA